MKTLRMKIKELRLEKGWSLREMSKKIPMSHVAYANIENGMAQPAWDRIEKIAKIHCISPAELIQSTAVTMEDLKTQNSIDDLYEVLKGINLELQMIRNSLNQKSAGR